MQAKSAIRLWLLVAIIALPLIGAVLSSHEQARARDFRGDPAMEQQDIGASTDFSKFLHGSPNHARLPCLLCHRRENTSARPALPGANGHLPCAGCHAQQFANKESPICTICHTDVKSGATKSFPNLKSFRVKFDHARHIKMNSVSCATCHKPTRGGIAFSIPVGFNAHSICYRCHVPRGQAAGRDISSCGICHQLGGYSRTPSWTAAFRMNFSHAKHGTTQGLNCNSCHNIRAGAPQRRQVSAPQAANHHAVGTTQSCMSCHNGKTAFGGDDFSACKRCHTGTGWGF